MKDDHRMCTLRGRPSQQFILLLQLTAHWPTVRPAATTATKHRRFRSALRLRLRFRRHSPKHRRLRRPLRQVTLSPAKTWKQYVLSECANPTKRPMMATSQYTAKPRAVKRSEKQEVSSTEGWVHGRRILRGSLHT